MVAILTLLDKPYTAFIAEEISHGDRDYGDFKDEQNAASILEHEVQDLLYYVRRTQEGAQNPLVWEWVQVIAVALRALRQYHGWTIGEP